MKKISNKQAIKELKIIARELTWDDNQSQALTMAMEALRKKDKTNIKIVKPPKSISVIHAW